MMQRITPYFHFAALALRPQTFKQMLLTISITLGIIGAFFCYILRLLFNRTKATEPALLNIALGMIGVGLFIMTSLAGALFLRPRFDPNPQGKRDPR